MGATLTLKTPFTADQLEGKSAHVIFLPPEAAGMLAEVAARQLAYATRQLSELSFHKERLDQEGATDAAIAESLNALHALAKQAVHDAQTLRAAINGMTTYTLPTASRAGGYVQ